MVRNFADLHWVPKVGHLSRSRIVFIYSQFLMMNNSFRKLKTIFLCSILNGVVGFADFLLFLVHLELLDFLINLQKKKEKMSFYFSEFIFLRSFRIIMGSTDQNYFLQKLFSLQMQFIIILHNILEANKNIKSFIWKNSLFLNQFGCIYVSIG